MAVAPTQETGSVEEAKRRLREASAGFDPYALVRARPLSCAGGAFLLGLGWKWLRPGRAVPALAALSLQMAARRRVFRSSRTLPGQAPLRRRFLAPGESEFYYCEPIGFKRIRFEKE